jgi:hypothetical protein
MLIVREVFTTKPGQASKLAKLFRRVFLDKSKSRVMTDLVGNYNTVVVEMETESITEWAKLMENYKAGKPDPNMNPEVEKEMANYTDMYLTGRREIFQIVE